MNKLIQFDQSRHTVLPHRRHTPNLLLTLLLAGSLFLTACSNSKPSNPTTRATHPPAESMKDKAVLGVIKVRGGEMLERDIIPQLCQVFSLPEQEVKDKLAASSYSKLINTSLTDFHRMEGLIPPGNYEIDEGSTLDKKVSTWIAASEKRYNKLLLSNTSPNNLGYTENLLRPAHFE